MIAQESDATPTPAGTPASGAAIATTGQAVPELAAFDDVMTGLVADWGVPGGQLAVAKDGRLVFDRAYGLADVEAGEPFQPGSLCRIASVSKAITTVAVLALVDDGQLALDDRAFRLLAALPPPMGAPTDPRLDEITIEHLLVHAGGLGQLDRGGSPGATMDVAGGRRARRRGAAVRRGDRPRDERRAARLRPWHEVGLLQFRLQRPRPRHRAGFGQSYEAFVRERVLAPAGVTRMRIGRTRLEERAPGEVHYYAPPGQAPLPSIFPGEGYGPAPYAAFYLESFDAHGGWIASAADLVRFATAIDGQRGPALLRPETIEAMLRTPRPAAPIGSAGTGNAEPGMGLGWDVLPGGGWVRLVPRRGSHRLQHRLAGAHPRRAGHRFHLQLAAGRRRWLLSRRRPCHPPGCRSDDRMARP